MHVKERVKEALERFGFLWVGRDRQAVTMKSMLERLASRVPSVTAIIDVGASDGKWSVLANRVFPGIPILAIEPLQEREVELATTQRTLAAHTFFDYRICAAGECESVVTLTVTPDLDGSLIDVPGEKSREVPVVTLDSLAQNSSLGTNILIKLDTHGFEKPILTGATQLLRDTVAIVVEVYNFNMTQTTIRFPEMCTFIENLGFRMVDLADPLFRPKDKAFWQADFLFIRQGVGYLDDPQYG